MTDNKLIVQNMDDVARAAQAMVKSPINLPCGFSMGDSTIRPCLGKRLVITRSR